MFSDTQIVQALRGCIAWVPTVGTESITTPEIRLPSPALHRLGFPLWGRKGRICRERPKLSYSCIAGVPVVGAESTYWKLRQRSCSQYVMGTVIPISYVRAIRAFISRSHAPQTGKKAIGGDEKGGNKAVQQTHQPMKTCNYQ